MIKSDGSAERVMTKREDRAERLAETSFQRLLDSVQDYAICMLDAQGRVVSWNPGAERLKGYSAAEIIGQHFSIFFTKADRERNHPEHELATVRRVGRYEETGWRARKDGTHFWAHVVITPVRDESGKLVGYAKVTRDLTESKRAEERLKQSEEKLRLLIESVRDYAIFMLDPEGYITSWNSGAQRLKGYTSNEIIGKHFSIFYSQADRDRRHPQAELAIVRRDGRYEEEGWRIRKDGTAFWANVVISAIRDSDNTLRGFAKVTRDLTEKYRAEARQRETDERLSLETARAREAHLAVTLRDEFISIAAHELRTPLSALTLKLQSAGRLLESVKHMPAELQKLPDRLAGADNQATRLSDLVERLLDVSRITHGQLQLHMAPTNLVDIAEQVVDDLAETARMEGGELWLHGPPRLEGVWDGGRIAQVIMNLVSNAIKYGAGLPVEVILAGSTETATIVVKDRGIGISAENLERIFDRFERAAAPISHYAGLGLGLYITRYLVEAHGGHISATSEPGQGTTFTVLLPRETVGTRTKQDVMSMLGTDG